MNENMAFANAVIISFQRQITYLSSMLAQAEAKNTLFEVELVQLKKQIEDTNKDEQDIEKE